MGHPSTTMGKIVGLLLITGLSKCEGGLLDIFQKLEDKTFCPSPGHVSDNFCDDENNIASCYWDGGDCCERRVPGWESYCSECACKDPGFLSACPSEENYGDQFCDDDNNVAACNWDGGDCCNSLMPGWDTYCAECRCKDPSQGGAAQGCMEPNHVGDGYCDDGNNNDGCQWDGGDCCYNTGESWDDYCQECACKDPAKIEQCMYADDSFCDDANNNPDCMWDGGACCNNFAEDWDRYCSQCKCLDPAVKFAKCHAPRYAQDLYCDDENNNAECKWDGGDCCNNEAVGWKTYCEECACKDPAQLKCDQPGYVGDQYCDDGNNKAECNWDGGDCCNNDGENWWQYCQECQCKDPKAISNDCGLVSDEGKIVGGNPADPHSIPWQVGLVSTNLYKPFCGGTIVSARFVMTAAHCTEGETLSGFYVLASEHDTSDHADFATRHSVISIRDHPSYKGKGKLDYDFSLLEVDPPFDLSGGSKARAACLPSEEDAQIHPQTTFVISGWGKLKYSGWNFPNTLHHVSVPWVSDSQCKALYGSKNEITARMMCAGNPVNGGVDSCQGDSGGPMTMVDPTTSRVKLIGVVSWGIGCGFIGYPGVYAEVTSVLQWVKDTMSS